MSEEGKAAKKVIAETVLSVITAGLILNGVGLWRDSAVQDHRINGVESEIKEIKKDNSALQEKIDDIHWYLIESKGVNIKRKNR